MNEMTQHLDYDVLADLAEGLLDETAVRDVEAHLDECEECGRKLEDLSAVSQLLASAPMPVMPDSLAARLDEALMAEAAKASVPSLAARRRVRGYQLLSAAAAVVVVGGVGTGVVVGALRSGSEAPDAKAVVTIPTKALPKVTHTGTEYRADRLVEQVRRQIGGDLAAERPQVSDQLLGCIQRISKGQRIAWADQAKYEGKDATIIVIGTEPGPVDVWVVGPNCSSTVDDQIIHRQVPA
ncbi:hypothetical protein GCM10027589_02230 [Actinocorallia lasiicapitis]